MPVHRVLAIDPGRQKCGLAVVDREKGLISRSVVTRESLAGTLREWCARFQPDLLLLGQGTGSSDLLSLLEGLPVPFRRVTERDSTRQARHRYFADHPPRGWRRLIPLTLQSPPAPLDDYAACIIAERFLDQSSLD